MKTVVFAYHDMGCLGIEALLAAGYEISAIFTHTDNPGEKAFYGSVARLAAERGIPVYAPDDVNHPLWVERIAQLSYGPPSLATGEATVFVEDAALKCGIALWLGYFTGRYGLAR